MRVGLGHEGGLQRPDLRAGPVAGVPYPHPKIQGDLIVSRSRRVQPAGFGADQFRQSGFHVHMDIFERVAEREGPGRHLGLDRREPVQNQRCRIACNDAGLLQHRRVRP